MRILLINPPYQTLTSNLGVGHQVPLGLLMVGGAIGRQCGHEVRLLDAEARRLSVAEIGRQCAEFGPDMVMTGHAGSTPAHPVCARMLQEIKRAVPRTTTVYGGVFPTYHAEWILRHEPSIDVIVRGEGEATACDVVRALGMRRSDAEPGGVLREVPAIAFRDGDQIRLTADRPPIADLNEYPTAWELIDDWSLYHCFGLGRAAIVQFSRGCPHRCTYCGQHGFWVKWRHRDPAALADEIAMLHDQHGVRFITLADENPTTSPTLWREFLEEVVRRRVDVRFFATIRATDIVRDEKVLELYRRAGVLYVLLGIDTTDPATQERINKRSTMPIDARACRLLAAHGIRSIVGHIVGLGTETWTDFRRARRVLSEYGGDLLNVMYATPHSWTSFARESASRAVVEPDLSRWDYRHQVLGESRMSPAELFLAVKLLELLHHLHPRRMAQLVLHPNAELRRQFRWTAWHIGSVWLGEIMEFLMRRRRSGARPLQAWLEDFHPPSAISAVTKCLPGDTIPLTICGRRRPLVAQTDEDHSSHRVSAASIPAPDEFR